MKIVDEGVQKLKEEGERLQREVRQRTIGYVTAGFGVVAGLAWNDAIGSLIAYIFPLSTSTILAKFVYAIIVTIVVVIVSLSVSRAIMRDTSSR